MCTRPIFMIVTKLMGKSTHSRLARECVDFPINFVTIPNDSEQKWQQELVCEVDRFWVELLLRCGQMRAPAGPGTAQMWGGRGGGRRSIWAQRHSIRIVTRKVVKSKLHLKILKIWKNTFTLHTVFLDFSPLDHFYIMNKVIICLFNIVYYFSHTVRKYV